MTGIDFYKKNIHFIADRYEEWQFGQCISKGPIQTEIIGEVRGNGIHFELDDIGEIQMLKSFDFETFDMHSDILPDRIQYTHATSDFNPIVPMICHLFYNRQTITYVRFAMTNPDRLVEFYGSLISVGEPVVTQKTTKNSNTIFNSNDVIKELSSYGMMNTGALMERAVDIYNKNADVDSATKARNIVESLKIFIKTYQLNNEESPETNVLKPKLLMYIALCNYKIGNFNQAYCIAKQGLDAVEEAIQNSSFIGIPKSMLGADTLTELVDYIENGDFDNIDRGQTSYLNYNPEDIDTSYLDRTSKELERPSKKRIKELIEIISKVQNTVSSTIKDPIKSFQIRQMLETYKLPLFFAWQGYDYGWHTDFCEEGDSLYPFMMFELDLVNNTQKFIDLLREKSPFSIIEKNSEITNALISVYTAFVNDLKNGNITV